ncbi:DUF924 domain-containing protein [Enterobacteriaceae bacterium H20N1]|uniref:DUF924 domain-containing protein n=1 Tax=Dryocola boscaweniae TaxID=2925397 RepID=A0A9X2WBD0_9ENTR|nr:DUF924 family protein [Dryocola boscaweniae]MCT4704026.1 DUF924 domain-containing protein [Dryocola boscaweniae]MCT4721194.1 DUF924 domain-containing protein [Dryocola boscaweniae]
MKAETAEDDESVLDFWFKETAPDLWFSAEEKLDEQIRSRFSAVYRAAIRGELVSWRESLSGRLAEVIILDQFSRNLFRVGPLAYAADGMALVLAQELVTSPGFAELPVEKRDFALMPYMHSESPVIHELALRMFQEYGSEQSCEFEKQHKQVIDKFGRYPWRNEALGRPSTPEEILWLAEQK